jgi:protein disulfide-isomerase A1
MVEQTRSTIVSIDTEGIEEFRNPKTGINVLAFYDEQDREHVRVFEEVANKKRGPSGGKDPVYTFGTSCSLPLAQSFNITKFPACVLFKAFDEGQALHHGAFSARDILETLEFHRFPCIGEIGPDTYQDYVNVSSKETRLVPDN